MSKTLHLIRHAKSSWNDPGLADIDRPLNKRGKRDCRFMGEHIKDAGCDFNNVYCSPAKRAQLTIQGLFNDLDCSNRTWVTEQDLYTFDYRDLMEFCQRIDETPRSIVIVGHNPAITELSQFLVSDCDIDNVPTCAYVQIDLAIDAWQEIKQSCGRLNCFVKPKQFL